MSIVRLSGGIGNQLFQFVFSQTLTDHTGESSILDASEYRYRNKNSFRPLEVHRFLNCNLINTPNMFTSHYPTRVSLHFERESIKKLNNQVVEELPVLREVGEVYDPSLKFMRGKYYIGHFISHKYWIREPDYYFHLIYNALQRKYHLELNDSIPVVGMHIRRGDYINNAKVRNLHGYCKDDYYLNALSTLRESTQGVKQVLISTDSLDKIKNLIKRIQDTGLTVKVIDSTDPILSLLSLAACDYFIGSNSTFSWWASNLSPKKISIFPTDWFQKNSNPFVLQDYFPGKVVGIQNALTSEALIT